MGGDPGIRDLGLLESATATPAQSFGGQPLHEDVPAIAAAYTYHICLNHPFVDGNKRAATAAMIAFLSDNGWSFDATADQAEPIVLQLAAGAIDKAAFTSQVRPLMREKPKLELRDFFRQIDAVKFTNRIISILPGETGANPNEFAERCREAVTSMPFLDDLARQQREAQERRDQSGWDRVTMLAVGALALYALAEDMGYEW